MLVCDGGNNDSTDSSLLEWRYDGQTAASLGVVDALATLEDVDPTEFADEVGATLRDSIDPKALDAIVGDGDGSGDVRVKFGFQKYRILVDDAGRIRVFDRE